MPTIAGPYCPEQYPEPKLTDTKELEQFRVYLWMASNQLQVPYELLVAQSFQESSWSLTSYRYEPNYDASYISRSTKRAGEALSPLERWSRSKAWIPRGPSVEEWFTSNPKRARERQAGRSYAFVAQTRIAASYGPMQCMYPTALDEGFDGYPEDLWQPENVAWPLKHLGTCLHWAQTHGATWSREAQLQVALARYNGGAYGNTHPSNLDDFVYVRWIEKRYRDLWGEAFFADVTPV